MRREGGGFVIRDLFILSNKFPKAITSIINHQHKYLLRICDELLGYMFRPLSDYFQAIKIHKIEIRIAFSFLRLLRSHFIQYKKSGKWELHTVNRHKGMRK